MKGRFATNWKLDGCKVVQEKVLNWSSKER